ncbi:MAG: hypothetical protein KGJ34_00075 [Patescibacteria group bacterium]|nr:hypothetical protein [Patescibacteria group bacterium]
MTFSGWRRYTLALFITAAIFGTAFYVAYLFNEARVADIRATEDQISIDLQSSETQYELLGSLTCSYASSNEGNPVLSDELNTLANQLTYAEDTLGSENSQVIQLKEQYSLLEIQDYLLLEKLSMQCGTHPIYILYFYSNAGDCSSCGEEGDVLTYLRETYPTLRVYSFDYHLDLSALKTLIELHTIAPTLPALIINSRLPVYGFKSVDDILKIAPGIAKLSTTTPTSSPTANTEF